MSLPSGIYYPPGSLKQQTCVKGRDMLVAFCEDHGVPYRIPGKILVASAAAQLPQLEAIRQTAAAAGRDLIPLDKSDLAGLEPELQGVAGLLSPLTGLIDSHRCLKREDVGAAEHGWVVMLSPVSSESVDVLFQHTKPFFFPVS